MELGCWGREFSFMSLAGSQQRTFLRLLAELRPHWRRDRHLPARIQLLLTRNRSFGSRDRRLYRELVYTTLRYLPWIEPILDTDSAEVVRRVAHFAAELPATREFRAAFASGTPPTGDKTELLPAWFRAHCPEAFVPPNLDVLLARAPLWLRFPPGNRTRIIGEFDRLGWRYETSSLLPSALRLLDEVDVSNTSAYHDGLVEVQDLGSQLVLESAGLASGGHWLDACAGAGGKTLQLAHLLGPAGRIDAHDIRSIALRELASRATRARLRVSRAPHRNPLPDPPAEKCHIMYDTRGAPITLLDDPPNSGYDGVLVDAPCSGSGTWRRAPHLKWTTAETDITAAARTQLDLLANFAPRVRPGGRLIYATCSLSRRENEEVVAAFLDGRRDFSIEAPARPFGAAIRDGSLTFSPALHDTDGFFVATLRRN